MIVNNVYMYNKTKNFINNYNTIYIALILKKAKTNIFINNTP